MLDLEIFSEFHLVDLDGDLFCKTCHSVAQFSIRTDYDGFGCSYDSAVAHCSKCNFTETVELDQ